MELAGAKVDWMLKWANQPHLEILMVGTELPSADRPWHFLPGVAAEPASQEQSAIIGGMSNYSGNFLVRRDPCGLVSFVFESIMGGGALGGVFPLVGGGEHKTKGGWSSNPTTVNRLRETDPRFREILPDPVVDISLFSDWSSDSEPGQGRKRFEKGYTAMATHCDLGLAQEAIDRYLPGVELHEHHEGYWVPGLSDGRRKPDPSEDIAQDRRARVR